MGAIWSFTKLFVAGNVLTASDLRTLQSDIARNFIPSGMDDQSANIVAMKVTTDPGEVGTESLATDLTGEIQRIRNIFKEVTGGAQWYVSPPDSLQDISGDISDVITAIDNVVKSGTIMLFKQASAPTSWTLIETNYNGSTMEIINDGTADVSGSFNVAQQGVHSISSGAPNHTHTISHHHNYNIRPYGNKISIGNDDGTEGSFTTGNVFLYFVTDGPDGTTQARTKTSTTNPTTSTESATFTPYYCDVIACSKD